jgi:hypothetical protein
MKLIILFSILLISCASNKDYLPHANPITLDNDYCAAAELNLKTLKCIPEDKPYTKKGKSFSEFCIDTQINGIFINPKCISTIQSCEDFTKDVCTEKS